MLARYFLSSCVRLFVRVSKVGVVQTAERRIMLTTPLDSPGTLVLRCERPLGNSVGITRNEGAKYRRGRLKLRFSTGREVYRSDALSPKMCVHPPRWSRPRQCAGGGIRGVVNNVGRRESLFITRTAHFSVTCM